MIGDQTKGNSIQVVTRVIPSGPRPRQITPGRVGIYAFMLISAAFFLLPFGVTLSTAFKSLDEVRSGNIFSLPSSPALAPWIKAWSTACIGLNCNGISAGFFNSLLIVIPSVLLAITIGALTGYALSFWRPRFANLLFGTLLLGAFLPAQIFIYPLVRIYAAGGLLGSLWAIVLTHVVFGLPLMSLMFRNYYASIPIELFNAARMDGGKFFSIFIRLILPLSPGMIAVAVILQVTHVWNDYIMGLVFGGLQNRPMTVQLINLVQPSQGEVEYNVNMAGTILTAAVPLLLYFITGRLFVRGVAAGAVKG